MPTTTPPRAAKKSSRGPTKKELKARAKLEKAIAKGVDNAVREIARATVKEMSRRPPPEFQTWGVIKSRAWLKLATLCHRQIKKDRPKLDDLTSLAWRLGQIKYCDTETCVVILNPPKKEQAHA